MLSIEEIHKKLQDRNVKVIAEYCKVHANTISAIKNNINQGANYKTVKALSDYFEAQQ